jgi:hypothetical protein
MPRLIHLRRQEKTFVPKEAERVSQSEAVDWAAYDPVICERLSRGNLETPFPANQAGFESVS